MNRLASRLLLLVVGTSGLMSMGGCSVFSALNSAPYVDYEQVKVGESRMRVSEIIGPPKTSAKEGADNHLMDYHEFKSGTPGLTRLRVLGYLAGDFFTIGLSEIVFWPVELGLLQAKDYKGHVTYDTQERVNGYRIVGDDGKVKHEGGGISGAISKN
jgi:hypothetical protein